MSKFEELVKQDTPRLVVMFKLENEKEMFQWGVVGKMPLLSLIGFMSRIQGDVAYGSGIACPQSALVITWDEKRHSFSWYLHPDIPVDSLVGMMEAIKQTLVSSQMARQAASQQIILGPVGAPIRR